MLGCASSLESYVCIHSSPSHRYRKSVCTEPSLGWPVSPSETTDNPRCQQLPKSQETAKPRADRAKTDTETRRGSTPLSRRCRMQNIVLALPCFLYPETRVRGQSGIRAREGKTVVTSLSHPSPPEKESRFALSNRKRRPNAGVCVCMYDLSNAWIPAVAHTPRVCMYRQTCCFPPFFPQSCRVIPRVATPLPSFPRNKKRKEKAKTQCMSYSPSQGYYGTRE